MEMKRIIDYRIRSKKAMYFTMMTLAVLSIFIFVFMIPNYKRLGDRMTVVEMRVSSMNDFIKDLERDTERGLYISSFRAILSLEEYMIISGEFLSDTHKNFKEALLNGTIEGTNTTLMRLSTFPLWIEKIQEESQEFNIETNITLNDVTLYQDDPWFVGVSANLSFDIRDTTGIASWKMTKIINTSISIISFEDPLYIINSEGRTTNLINSTPFEGNFTFKSGQWNVSKLITHTENSYYMSSTNAPSFLMRLENDLGPSPHGIESLVSIKRLEELDLDLCSTCSIVDYHYWDDTQNGNYRINFTPGWFKLDAGHLEQYNVTGLNCEIGTPGCEI